MDTNVSVCDLVVVITHHNKPFFYSCFSKFTGGTSGDGVMVDDIINIFSVASGHLYERLLRYDNI